MNYTIIDLIKKQILTIYLDKAHLKKYWLLRLVLRLTAVKITYVFQAIFKIKFNSNMIQT